MAAVLQTDAEIRLDAARAKAHVIALDEADHQAVFIRSGQVNRAALGRVACFEILCTLHVNQLGAFFQIRLVQHLRRRHFHAAFIGHITVDIGKREFHGFDLHMLRIHAVTLQCGEVKVIQYAQGNQRGNALSVRRNFMQGMATVIHGNRRHPFRLVGGKVRGFQCAAVGV